MATMKELEEQLVVLAAIQRQSEVLKLATEELDAVRAIAVEDNRRIDRQQREFDLLRATSEQRMAEWDARIEKLVSGFGASLVV
jgi:hypothetical protein